MIWFAHLGVYQDFYWPGRQVAIHVQQLYSLEPPTADGIMLPIATKYSPTDEPNDRGRCPNNQFLGWKSMIVSCRISSAKLGAQHSFQCASKLPIQKGRPWRWTGSGRQNREHTPTSTDYIHKSWQTTGIFVYLCHCEIHEISGSVVWRHLDHSSSCPRVASVLITDAQRTEKEVTP